MNNITRLNKLEQQLSIKDNRVLISDEELACLLYEEIRKNPSGEIERLVFGDQNNDM